MLAMQTCDYKYNNDIN